MTRYVAVLVLLAWTGSARADTGMLPNNPNGLEWPKLYIAQDDGTFIEPPDPDSLRFYLNRANCICAQQQPDRAQSKIEYDLHIEVVTGVHRPVLEFVGTECDDDVKRPLQCRQLAETLPDVDELILTRQMTVNIYDMINGIDIKDMTTNMPKPCREDEAEASIWAAVDTDGDTKPDFFSPRDIDLGKFTGDVKGFDTKPPPLPDNLDVQGGESSVTITWDTPTARFEDLYYFQALCADVNGNAVKGGGDILFRTTENACGIPETTTIGTSTPSATTDVDRDVPTPPAGFTQFSNAFICGTEMSGTATSLTIDGLENGQQYVVALVAIDRSGNFVVNYFNRTVTPVPVTDLWEDIHDRGGNIEGGLCLMAETYGGDGPITTALRSFRDNTLATTPYGRFLINAYYATLGKLGAVVHVWSGFRVIAAYWLWPLVVIALLWHVLTLPGLLLLASLPWLWRRRSRVRIRVPRFAIVGGVLALVTLAPRLVRADEFTPYWEEDRVDASLADEEGTVRWHAGIRIGPYTPDIDKQLGVNMNTGIGPYRAMFGNYYTEEDGSLVGHDAHVYQILPMLDVDRVIWHGVGQFLVGGTIGYMQKSAYAYLDGTSPDDLFRPRSTAAKTTFRLIPLAATATYRFTTLDDDYGIPIVPYLRGGLSYYVWWMTAPNGDLSAVCKSGMDAMNCDKNKAYGASLGFQGTVGLAIRAERIDADAARSMQQSGIYHAGFFGELQFARVDGFGSSTKLSVGGSTWFAGVDFEF